MIVFSLHVFTTFNILRLFLHLHDFIFHDGHKLINRNKPSVIMIRVRLYFTSVASASDPKTASVVLSTLRSEDLNRTYALPLEL